MYSQNTNLELYDLYWCTLKYIKEKKDDFNVLLHKYTSKKVTTIKFGSGVQVFL